MILSTVQLSETTVKTRWLEPYVTAGLNQKALAGDTRGVVIGFRVVPNIGYTVTIQADPTLGLSVANVTDTSTEKYSVTVVQTGDIVLDLVTWAGTTVYLALDAQYQIGSTSGAQLLVVDAAELAAPSDLIPIAKVNVPVSPPVVTTDINMGYRLSAGDSIPIDGLPPFNLVSNGTFERDTAGGAPSGWKALSGASLSPTVDASVFRSGTQSLRLSSGGAVTGSFGTNFLPVEPGQLVRASLWIRSSGGSPITGTGVTASVVWFDLAYAQLSTTQLEAGFTGGSTTFAQRQAEVTVPAGTAHAKLAINYVSCSGTLYVDDVQFLTRSGELLAHSPVLAGNGTVADEYHAHTAAGSNYAGSAPTTWADGTTLPAGTVEATFDTVVATIGGTAGAAKVGYTPTTPLDLTGVTRVDQALNTLDDLKAGINLANLFSKHNDFTNTGTPNASAITATGNGTGAGIIATGGSAINTPGGNFTSIAGTTGPGVQGLGSGTGPGVKGTGGSSSNSYGGEFYSNGPYGNGVLGQAVGIGVGVKGLGGTNTSDFTGNTLNPPIPGPGNGGTFIGAGGAAGGDGLQAWGQSTNASRTGILGVGAFPTTATVAGGTGVYGFGGTGGGGNSDGGYGVRGVAGARTGTGAAGVGVFGSGNALPSTIGVYGVAGSIFGVGVKGEATGSFSVGVLGTTSANNTTAVSGQGTAGFNTTGVLGTGGGAAHGGSFTGGELGGFGVNALGGQTSGSGIGVLGTGGLPDGRGVQGRAAGTGVGVVGRSSSSAATPPASGGVWGEGSVGVEGISDAAGFPAIGVKGTAGTSGSGVLGLGPGGSAPSNSAGVTGKGGSGGGPGMVAMVHGQTITDANTAGTGLYAIGGSNAGVVGLASGTGASANFAAGAGVAGLGSPGGYFAATSNFALQLASGFIVWSGGTDPGSGLNPLYTETAFHRLASKSVIKAWVSAVGVAGTPSGFRVIDGFNVSSISRTGTTPNSIYSFNWQTGIGATDKSGIGDDTNGFSLSGITVTFTKSGGSSFVAGDLGRSIVITGSTSAANDSLSPSENFGEFPITAVLNANQVQYINAAAVNEAFPSSTGVWTINEGPMAASIQVGDLSGTHVVPYVLEQRRGQLKFLFRDFSGAKKDTGLDTMRLMIIVTGPQY